MKFGFYLYKLKKQPFFANNFKIQERPRLPLPPLQTPMHLTKTDDFNALQNEALLASDCRIDIAIKQFLSNDLSLGVLLSGEKALK